MNIHTAWLGPRNEKADAAVALIKQSFPKHTVFYHTDDSSLWPAWRPAYDAIQENKHMASDLVRHSVLRRWPGLWLDLDVTLLVDPSELVADWIGYTALAIPGSPIVGTDVLYVHDGWSRWDLFDLYIKNKDLSGRISYLCFAHDMIVSAYQDESARISIIDNCSLYPCRRSQASDSAVLLRCGLPKSAGLGDIVAAGLSSVGITPERVSRLTGKPCGCKRRQQALNQWGRRLGIGSTAGGKDARTRQADGQGRGDLPKAS
jgi:hypothetical protein